MKATASTKSTPKEGEHREVVEGLKAPPERPRAPKEGEPREVVEGVGLESEPVYLTQTAVLEASLNEPGLERIWCALHGG